MTNNIVTITVWKSGFQVPFDDFSSRVALRGELITLTPEQVEDTRDRNGNSWLDLTEEQQLARWGHVNFLKGDRSSDVKFIGDDDERIRFRRRERAIIEAHALSDPEERADALHKIRELYGTPRSSQRTLNEYGG